MLYDEGSPVESMSNGFQTNSNLPGSNNPTMQLTRYKLWRFVSDCVEETLTTVAGQVGDNPGTLPPYAEPEPPAPTRVSERRCHRSNECWICSQQRRVKRELGQRGRCWCRSGGRDWWVTSDSRRRQDADLFSQGSIVSFNCCSPGTLRCQVPLQ